MSVQEDLFKTVAEAKASSSNKVSVVGIGAVGMAAAFSILTQVSCYLLHLGNSINRPYIFR
jgi:hypothetical protein